MCGNFYHDTLSPRVGANSHSNSSDHRLIERNFTPRNVKTTSVHNRVTRGGREPNGLFVKRTVDPRRVGRGEITQSRLAQSAVAQKSFSSAHRAPKCVVDTRCQRILRNDLCCMWATWLLSLLNREGSEGLMTIDGCCGGCSLRLETSAAAERFGSDRPIVARPRWLVYRRPSSSTRGRFRKSRWVE